MAHITLTGVLLDPTGEFSVGDKVKFTHQSTTGNTIKSAVSVLKVPPNGAYSINLEYGLVLVEYNDYRLGQYRNLGITTVNATNTATSIPELLNALVPVSSAELIEFQAVLTDAVTAKTAAVSAATTAQAFAYQLTTTALIASTTTFSAATTIPTSGFTTSGDGGGHSWKQNGVTGQTVSQTPAQIGSALLNDGNGNQWALVLNGVIDLRATGVNTSNTPEVNTYTAQALVNSMILGGEIAINEDYNFKAIYDLDRTSLPPGYIANKEQRRANKAIIIYEAKDLVIGGTGTINRSTDAVSDTSYSEYSSSIYISKSERVKIKNIEILGYQDDSAIYIDNKTLTSGNAITINSGSKDCEFSGLKLKDGTNGIAVGINRTDAAQNIDPALAAVTGTKITNITAKNFEHPLLLADSKNTKVHIFNHDIEAGTGGTATGASQRGLFLHSCRDVDISEYTTNGTFKTGVFFRNYLALKNIKINGLTITQQTESVVKTARGTAYSSNEGIGLKFESDNCEDITVDNFNISSVARGVVYTDVGTDSVSLLNGVVKASSSGFSTKNLQSDATNLGAITDHTQQNVKYTVIQDLVNFPDATASLGFLAAKGGSFDHVNLVLDNITVRSENRNARVFDCGEQCKIINSTFSQITGLSGARNYDLLCKGNVFVGTSTFTTKGAFNIGNDVPALADVNNVMSAHGYNGSSGYRLYKYDGTTGSTSSTVGSWSLI
jgi:hypothetical protein